VSDFGGVESEFVHGENGESVPHIAFVIVDAVFQARVTVLRAPDQMDENVRE
jgi:hypothetical protein